MISNNMDRTPDRNIIGRLPDLVDTAVDRPILLYLKFWSKEGADSANRTYTHQNSSLICIPWNWDTVIAPFQHSGEALTLFKTRRRETMVGPRDAQTYIRYGDNGKPVDFHFLESYHSLVLAYPEDSIPQEVGTIWWPNIVVRLEEVYRAMKEIDLSDGAGAKRFFGFFAQPYVRMQEYWILINDKQTDIFSPGYVEALLNDADLEDGDYDNYCDRRLLDTAKCSDIKGKTVADLIAVNNFSMLKDRDRRRLRLVAMYLKAWGNTVPIQPRVVRWAKIGEGFYDRPRTVLELVAELDG